MCSSQTLSNTGTQHGDILREEPENRLRERSQSERWYFVEKKTQQDFLSVVVIYLLFVIIYYLQDETREGYISFKSKFNLWNQKRNYRVCS